MYAWAFLLPLLGTGCSFNSDTYSGICLLASKTLKLGWKRFNGHMPFNILMIRFSSRQSASVIGNSRGSHAFQQFPLILLFSRFRCPLFIKLLHINFQPGRSHLVRMIVIRFMFYTCSKVSKFDFVILLPSSEAKFMVPPYNKRLDTRAPI